MMLVWRVQDAEGRGPYLVLPGEDSSPATQCGCPCFDCEQAPMPFRDFDVPHHFDAWLRPRRFGFLRAEDALAWFGPEGLARLAERGFRLVQVPAREVEVSRSGRQVVFLPARAEPQGGADPPPLGPG